jgi:hypothetical protein
VVVPSLCITNLAVQIDLLITFVTVEPRTFGTSPAIIDWEPVHELAIAERCTVSTVSTRVDDL